MAGVKALRAIGMVLFFPVALLLAPALMLATAWLAGWGWEHAPGQIAWLFPAALIAGYAYICVAAIRSGRLTDHPRKQ